MLTVAVPAAVAPIEDFHQQFVTLGAYAQPHLLFMVREIVEHHHGIST